MIRRLFTVVSVLSLLLCVAGELLWARGHSVTDCWTLRRDRMDSGGCRMIEVMATSAKGTLELIIGHATGPGPASPSFRYSQGPPFTLAYPTFTPALIDKGGFRVVMQPAAVWSGVPVPDGSQTVIDVPDWFIVSIFSFIPLLWSIRQRRRRDVGRRLCPACRYDLHGNVSGTCPECGTPIRSKLDGADQLELINYPD